ncbi:aryl hydrocarbon receptor-like [Amphibalanus amphitrite]|uniref:aryl hydrocarbon receptor-like n=1 Tax=Amphibalanus amphitrite TaxID=1232801 RepID=UPI001C9108B0|nr:aryl hydrocarbon receptor-like [Amphibalanus amphitrite]
MLSHCNMNPIGTVYATKRRRRNGKSLKPQPADSNAKSNPSKRHRLRLNAELDTLASLLPYEQNILSKLDRLSILRLAVAYLRTKSYFQVSASLYNKEDTMESQYRREGMLGYDSSLDGEAFLQALNGFLFILDCEGEVFFSTHTIENYLGFHQSDIVHQSVYELVHSEDRDELQRQFLWNGFLPPERANMTVQEALQPENAHLLERSFTVRFRCLLDNTSGFLRLDIRGRIRVLQGQHRKSEEPVLALFALCTPFGPPSLLDMPQKELMFKSKHKLDLTMLSIDQRGKMLLGYSDSELVNRSGYAMVHHDDLAYVASAHQELLKTGASGLIAYRLQTKDLNWQWLQTSSRLVYKNSKPDFIISTHRPLLEEEGRDLLGKRTMDFKVSYLDPGLTSQYLYDGEVGASGTAGRGNRRYKTQLRDFLSTCRTKRKLTPEYPADPAAYNSYAAAAGVYPAAATSYTDPAAAALYQQNLPNFQNLYPPIENRFLATDSLYYRQLGGYYPDYMHHGSYNGFVDVGRTCLPTYETSQLAKPGEYGCQLDATKYATDRSYLPKTAYYDGYPGGALLNASLASSPIGGTSLSGLGSAASASLQQGFGSTPERDPRHTPDGKKHDGDVSPDMKAASAAGAAYSTANDTRQTVLMWGSAHAPRPNATHVICSPSGTSAPAHYTHSSAAYGPQSPPYGERPPPPPPSAPGAADPIKSMTDMSAACKWAPKGGGSPGPGQPTASKPPAYPSGYGEPAAPEVWAPYSSLSYNPAQSSEGYAGAAQRNGTLCCPTLR